MKHIKLLPILSASTLICTVTPIITNCNKKEFDGKLTNEEISNAIKKVTDANTWNYTCDVKASLYNEGQLPDISTGIFQFENNGIYIKTTDDIGEEITYFKKYDNKWFKIEQRDSKYQVISQHGNNPIVSSALAPWIELSYLPEVITYLMFSQEHKGYYYTKTYESSSKTFFIRFNESKNLDYACFIDSDEENGEITLWEFKYRDYGSTKQIEFPFKDEDINYPKDTALTYDADKKYYVNSGTDTLVYGCTFKANSALLNPTKITVYKDDELYDAEFESVSIYVNGVKSNCTVTNTTEDSAEATITGLTLHENDSVQVVWNLDEFDEKPTEFNDCIMHIS